VLVAGVGNVFLADDGFGVEVVRRFAAEPQPDGVTVSDFGIRGLHLAYELLDGYDTTILVDASPRGGRAGDVVLVEVDPADLPPTPTPAQLVEQGAVLDAHGMTPAEVLALLRMLGGTPGRVFVLGCEPARIREEIGLSAPVAAAVDVALAELRRLVAQEIDEGRAALRPARPTARSGEGR
jgi:hydrogenase maturation protease